MNSPDGARNPDLDRISETEGKVEEYGQEGERLARLLTNEDLVRRLDQLAGGVEGGRPGEKLNQKLREPATGELREVSPEGSGSVLAVELDEDGGVQPMMPLVGEGEGQLSEERMAEIQTKANQDKVVKEAGDVGELMKDLRKARWYQQALNISHNRTPQLDEWGMYGESDGNKGEVVAASKAFHTKFHRVMKGEESGQKDA